MPRAKRGCHIKSNTTSFYVLQARRVGGDERIVVTNLPRSQTRNKMMRTQQIWTKAFATAIVAVAFESSNLSFGEEVNFVSNGDAEAGSVHPWSGAEMESMNVFQGSRSFSVNNRTPAINRKKIEVDPEANYELVGWFSSAGPVASNLNFGLICFDAENELIRGPEITFVEGTEARLREEAKEGTHILKIDKGSAWLVEPRILSTSHVAFNVDDSGNYGDLPNRNLSGRGILGVKQSDGQWEIELAEPLAKDFPVGTKIRQHRQTQSYLYVLTDRKVPEEWTQFSGKVGGMTERGVASRSFWPGTRFVQVVAFPLDTAVGKNDSRLLMDDVELRSR